MRVVASCCLVLMMAGGYSPLVRADVELKPEEREHLGIRTEPARLMEEARRWPAAGTVMDVAPLVTALSDLQAAEVAAKASRAEAERTDKLYHDDTNVARKALDAAFAQATADRGKLAAARGQLLSSWGRSVASLSPAERQKLIDDLLAGRLSLARAEPMSPLPADAQIGSAQLIGLNGSRWSATSLGPLPQAAGVASAGALLLRVAAALPAGQLLQVTLTEDHPSLRGPTVPASAVIRWHGEEWVYEEAAQNHFARHAVRPGSRVADRALLDGEMPPDRPVVTVGARALLGAELGASAAHDAEAGD